MSKSVQFIFLWGLCVAGAVRGSDALPAAGADPAAVRLEFINAMQRVHSHAVEPPDSPALQAYVIYDYLIAARLQRDLLVSPSDDLDVAIDAFLKAHTDQPVGRDLQRQWLLSLADRKRWDWFLPRTLDATDPTLICERLQGRLLTGDMQGLGAVALLRWSVPQKQPPQCDTVFAWLRTQKLLDASLAETRARAALAAGNARLARDFAADVPPPQLEPLLQWAQLLDAPRAALNALASAAAAPVESDALIAGFTRLSRTDSAAALELLPQLLSRRGMTPTTASALQRAAALGAAYDHNLKALAAFEALPAQAVDSDVQEWRVRAALWAGDFKRARGWIEQMPPALATQPRWRYWLARSLAASAHPDLAAPIYAQLATSRDYYGYLAADQEHQDYNLNARASLDDPVLQAMLEAEPGLVRARELIACDLSDDAALEWSRELASADAATKLQAAHLAARWGWYDQAIATLAQAGEWDDVRLRYPRPFSAAVAAANQLTLVPLDWILAVMRQESLYRHDAVSRANARGLMQMEPSTALSVARHWHLPAPKPDSLFDPDIAVPLGAAHLRDLLDHYNGQLDVTLAAYNAGPSPAARWLPPQTMDADVWIENIPYNETRGYVQHILEHIIALAFVREAQPPRLAVLLPPLDPSTLGDKPAAVAVVTEAAKPVAASMPDPGASAPGAADQP